MDVHSIAITQDDVVLEFHNCRPSSVRKFHFTFIHWAANLCDNCWILWGSFQNIYKTPVIIVVQSTFSFVRNHLITFYSIKNI